MIWIRLELGGSQNELIRKCQEIYPTKELALSPGTNKVNNDTTQPNTEMPSEVK